MCLHENLYPVVVHVKISTLIKRGQNWHLMLVQSLLVLQVVKEVNDLERRGRPLTLAGTLVRELHATVNGLWCKELCDTKALAWRTDHGLGGSLLCRSLGSWLVLV